MLDWLSGPTSPQEPPETPAHLFAVKAFKSALFGTPAPPQDGLHDILNNDGTKSLDTTGDDTVTLSEPKEKLGHVTASPAKGILLTPGTVAARRKTVSFSKTKLSPMSNGTDPLQASYHDFPQLPNGQREIRRTLFKRSRSARADDATEPKDTEQYNTCDQPKPHVPLTEGTDVTLDLKQPRSVSGKHWMHEYQRDHAGSKAEMKNLIRYSQLAKDHAARRDRETLRLKAKLQQSEVKIAELERKLEEATLTHPQTNLDEYVGEKRSQLQDAIPDNPEVDALRAAAEKTTKKAAALERDNENFKKTILRVKEEMSKYEARHKNWIDQRKKKDERHAAQRDALKEKILLQKAAFTKDMTAMKTQSTNEKAALLQEIQFLREVASTSPACLMRKEVNLVGRQLSKDSEHLQEDQRVKGVPADLEQNPEQNIRKSNIQIVKSDVQQLPEASSPTILDNHVRLATRKDGARRSTLNEIALPQILAAHEAEKKPLTGSNRLLSVDLQPRNPLPHISDLPMMTKKRGIGQSIRAQKPGQAKTRNVHANKRCNPSVSGRSGLPADREAAARLRIAQRSTEKQPSTRFFFTNPSEGRAPLQERLVNM